MAVSRRIQEKQWNRARNINDNRRNTVAHSIAHSSSSTETVIHLYITSHSILSVSEVLLLIIARYFSYASHFRFPSRFAESLYIRFRVKTFTKLFFQSFVSTGNSWSWPTVMDFASQISPLITVCTTITMDSGHSVHITRPFVDAITNGGVSIFKGHK